MKHRGGGVMVWACTAAKGSDSHYGAITVDHKLKRMQIVSLSKYIGTGLYLTCDYMMKHHIMSHKKP